MTEERLSAPPSEEERKARASNRRTIIAFGVIVIGLTAPAAYRIGRHLIDLL